MPSRELPQAIDCIDSILGSDNKNLINQIDSILNFDGISIKSVCNLIDEIPDDLSKEVLDSLFGKISNFGALSPGNVASYGEGLVKGIIEKAEKSVKSNMETFSDLESLGSKQPDIGKILKGQSDKVQAELNKCGLSTVDANDLLDDTSNALSDGKIGDLARMTRDGMKEAFNTLSEMGSDMLKKAPEGKQPDFNEGARLAQDLVSANPYSQKLQMATQIANSLCDVYDFLSGITGTANCLLNGLSDPFRGLDIGISLQKDACVSLIEDILDNGLPDDVCNMNSHYGSNESLFSSFFGSEIIGKISAEINGIVRDLLKFKSDLDIAFNLLGGEISLCSTRSDYSNDSIRKLIDANNNMFNSYNSLHCTYNTIIEEVNQDVTIIDQSNVSVTQNTQNSSFCTNQNLKNLFTINNSNNTGDKSNPIIRSPLSLSTAEIDYLNSLFNSANTIIGGYLNTLRDISLAEEIKRFDFLDKYKMPYRNQRFNLGSNRSLIMGTQGLITGNKFNYLDDNTSQFIIKCNEF